MVSYVLDLYEATEPYVSEGKDILVLVNPLFHIMGKGTFMGIALSLGEPDRHHALAARRCDTRGNPEYRATLLLGVPALYRMILDCDRLDTYDLSSLRHCWSGGRPPRRGVQ